MAIQTIICRNRFHWADFIRAVKRARSWPNSIGNPRLKGVGGVLVGLSLPLTAFCWPRLFVDSAGIMFGHMNITKSSCFVASLPHSRHDWNGKWSKNQSTALQRVTQSRKAACCAIWGPDMKPLRPAADCIDPPNAGRLAFYIPSTIYAGAC